MEQILTGTVRNQPGVLVSIAEKFRDMNVNIISIVAAPTDDENMSYISIVTEATDFDIETIEKNLEELVEIGELDHLGQGDHYERELLLVKISTEGGHLSQIMQVAEVFGAHTVGVGPDTMTLQFVGDPEQVRGLIRMVKPFGIRGLARTGRTALKKDD